MVSGELFSYGGSSFGAYVFACAFGIGWGLSYLAGCVVPLEYFGRDVAAADIDIGVVALSLGNRAGNVRPALSAVNRGRVKW